MIDPLRQAQNERDIAQYGYVRAVKERDEALAEVARLRELAGEFFADLSYMGDYLFFNHHRHTLKANPWLEKWNPYPEGCSYFPETLPTNAEK